jgi:DNA topoisomerase-2
MPIIPMLLVNGGEGIGTGWSSFLPNYNPRIIVDNIKRLMAGEEQYEMVPWYRGFKVHDASSEQSKLIYWTGHY